MAFPRSKSVAVKVQLKCHKCRQPCVRGEGGWHQALGMGIEMGEVSQDQVFLCKSCKPAGPRIAQNWNSFLITPDGFRT